MIALAKPDNRIAIDTVLQGDALAMLRGMADNSVDAIVTDPPAGVGFMGKEWDTFSPEYMAKMAEREKKHSLGPQTYNGKPRKRSRSAFANSSVKSGTYDLSRKGRDAFVKSMTDIFTEALRVLKPGGHALVWALPRTSHWTALALEDAGFEIRDCVYHVFGSGFPKSLDVSKSIDKHLGKERETVRSPITPHTTAAKGFSNEIDERPWMTKARQNGYHEHAGDVPISPEAEQWDGFGTSLKPAVECWWLCRKPLAEPSIAANVLTYGTGGLNIAASRVGNETRINRGMSSLGVMHDDNWQPKEVEHVASGRWPANLLLSHSLWCVPNGTKRVRGTAPAGRPSQGKPRNGSNLFGLPMNTEYHGYFDEDGMEEVEDWHCAEDCPIRLLDEQSGVRKGHHNISSDHRRYAGNQIYGKNLPGTRTPENSYGDQGGASRYFTNLPPDVPFCYTAKASRSERNAGCEGLPEQANRINAPRSCEAEKFSPATNGHPTVKPLSLMRWLVRLVTPPDGIVLDPFAGSGSTLVACVQEGYHFIGVEQDESYVAISEARIAHARREVAP